MKKGFTLVEILVAVMIVTILVAMAVPMYEKTIERSRLSEAYSTLKKVYDAKVRLMDEIEQDTYDVSTPQFGFENLDYTFNCVYSENASNSHIIKCASEDFTYVLNPIGTGNANYVCAARRIGDNIGVNFLYGVDASGVPFIMCDDPDTTSTDAHRCQAYGMPNTGTSWCNEETSHHNTQHN